MDSGPGRDNRGAARHGKCPIGGSNWSRLGAIQTREVPIRSLAVGLLAVAAIAASLTLVRQRPEHREVAPLAPVPDGRPSPPELNLEAIRTAGL